APHRAEPPTAVRQVALLPDGADAVEDAAVGRDHEPFTADAEEHDRVLDARGHLTGDPQPRAVEDLAPRRARLDGPEGVAVELIERDRLGRAHDLGGQRRDPAVDAAADPTQPPEFLRLIDGGPDQPDRRIEQSHSDPPWWRQAIQPHLRQA